MTAALKKGRFLSAFIYALLFSSDLSAASYSEAFIEQFVRIMHANPIGNGWYQTEFTNPRLYSSTNQRFVPEEEINKLTQHVKMLAEQQNLPSYYCQYPATYQVIQSNLLIFPKADFKVCTELTSFIQDVEDISIVFAAGYMGNPASYFGHMFVKLGRSSTKLSNETLNVGANVPKGENPVSYMMRGLFGSYQTQYTSTSYYKQSHSYSQLEGRDLYEYKLDLNADKVLFLSLHLYELQQADFTYYFTNRNCAYEIYRLLIVLSQLEELHNTPLFYPVHLVAYLNKHKLISRLEYTPANKTKFSQLYFAVTNEKRELIADTILRLQSGEDITGVAQLIDKDIAEIILYYGYAHLDNDLDKNLLNSIKKLRLFFPPGKVYENKLFTKKDLASRFPIMASINWVNKGNANGLGLVFRPAHYNRVDSPNDVGDGGKLVFLQTSIFIDEDIILDSFDLIDVYKSEIGKTALYGDDELEWGLNISYQNVYRENNQSNDLFSASGYIGDVHFIGANTWLQYGIRAGVRNNVSENGNAFIAPTLNFISQYNANTNIVLSVAHEFGFFRATNQGTLINFSTSSQLNRSSAISSTYKKDLFGRTFSVGYHHYF